MELLSGFIEGFKYPKKIQTRVLPEIEGEFLFTTKVVGTLFKSGRGCSRQKVIRKLKKGAVLHLKPDFDHKYFANAVAVVNRRGEDIGHLPSMHGASMRQEFEGGSRFYAIVTEIRGGMFQDKYVDLEVYRFRELNRKKMNKTDKPPITEKV